MTHTFEGGAKVLFVALKKNVTQPKYITKSKTTKQRPMEFLYNVHQSLINWLKTDRWDVH